VHTLIYVIVKKHYNIITKTDMISKNELLNLFFNSDYVYNIVAHKSNSKLNF
jgi:hypothetical protein